MSFAEFERGMTFPPSSSGMVFGRDGIEEVIGAGLPVVQSRCELMSSSLKDSNASTLTFIVVSVVCSASDVMWIHVYVWNRIEHVISTSRQTPLQPTHRASSHTHHIQNIGQRKLDQHVYITAPASHLNHIKQHNHIEQPQSNTQTITR